jgi:oxaloacetate decarboxylase alpha subunit
VPVPCQVRAGLRVGIARQEADAGHALRCCVVPQLFDTTVRLLSQEPLAGRVPTGEVLRVAEILDGAGFACLEVSGGGVFDASVRRGVESPWERIRAIDARTTTPLGLALRGRFLVGSKPVSQDIVRRFVACAADNGIDVFRLHDPLNDVSNLREAGDAIVRAGKELHVGLVYSAGGSGEVNALVEQAGRLGELGATRVLLNDPTGGLLPHVTQELVERLGEASGLPVGLYIQAAGGTALANALVATRVGADVVATAVYPLALTLHRIAGESLVAALEGLGRPTGVDVARLWQAADVVDEHLGDEPLAPLAPRIAVRAAEYDLPAGLVAALDAQLRAHAAGDRLLDTLAEVVRIREESGRPPLAAPVGQILGSQAFLNVLSAHRYRTVLDEFRQLVTGAYGTPPAAIEPSVRRAVELLGGDAPALDEDPPSADDVREAAEGLASSEEDLVLLAMFGDEAETLLQTIRRRHSREASLLAGDVDAERGERIRELVRIVQESGVGEIEIEDEGMRVSVRRADEPGAVPAAMGGVAVVEQPADDVAVGAETVRVESPMVGIFYRAPQPGAPPFVEIGDVVAVGQTLCMLEAMKLFNELKADVDARVRSIHADNGQPVEFGTLLFELEPVGGPPVV